MKLYFNAYRDYWEIRFKSHDSTEKPVKIEFLRLRKKKQSTKFTSFHLACKIL